jgi:UDP-N-acetyl-D-glucosamine dehydrogenase
LEHDLFFEDEMPHPLLLKLQQRDATIGVIGLGYVGLPLVLAFGKAGFRVRGFDIDTRKPESLLRGESYIRHIPSSEIQELVRSGRFSATTDYSQAATCDALIICVPTPLTKAREPDMSFIVGTSESIMPHLRRDQLVVLESTTYPGTTVEVMKPILERSGLKEGTDFLIAFSPEREDPGNARFTTVDIPKVIGADTPDARACTQALYSSAFKRVVPVSSTQAAELTKLLENIFRAVNIALVNELKMLCDRMGIDVWEVIDAAATKPFGYMPFYPGPGLGGHCIPIDPFYLTWKAREYQFSTRFIELAGEINTGMPHYVVMRTMESLNEHGKAMKGSRILVVGLAYKKDVDDVRESPAFEVIELLEQKGAHVSYHDPYVPKTHRMRKYDLEMTSLPLNPETLHAHDAVLIVTDHSSVDYELIVREAPLVIDTRNATRKVTEGRSKIVKA